MSSDNSLSTSPGSQLQGINTKGISINKDYVEVFIDWKDASTGRLFDPTTYSVSITKDGAAYTLSKVMTPLSRVDDSIGVWHYAFLTTDMTAGTYTFTFTGSASGISTVTHTISFVAASIPVEQYFVGALRSKLGDKRSSRYLIDDEQRTRWQDGELYSFMESSRLSVGQTPPSPMNLTYEQGFSECHDLLLTGGFIFALESRGVFENFQRFSYSDELSLNIDRSNFFQNAQSLRAQWQQAVLRWKRDYMFHAVRGIGMASGRFPMYYTRVLSLLPHMSRVFYG